MTKHCSREEILSGARKGALKRKESRAHLQECDECRSFWELACLFAGADSNLLAHAPTGWIEHAAALGQTRGKTRKVLETIGRLVFDSWAAPAAVGLRGDTAHATRRLAWELEEWSIELRAESATAGWEVVAQVSRDGQPQRGIELSFGSDKAHTDASGMAVWSGIRPPGNIIISSPDGDLHLEKVNWKTPKF